MKKSITDMSNAARNAALTGGITTIIGAMMGMPLPVFAKGGLISSPTTGLTGEENPEIVWNKQKGYSYITGLNGPEFRQL